MRTFHKTEDQGDFVICPEGTTAAVLTCLAFLGRHESTWNGEPKIRELVGLSWELGEPGPAGRALAVTETLTASLHEKAKFYSRVLALTGGREPPAGFDLSGLLNRGAIVTVAHAVKGDRTYANVVAVGPLPRGLAAPVPSIPPVFFDLAEYNAETFDLLPKRFQRLAETALSDGYTAAPPAPAAPARPAPRQPGPPPAQPDWSDDIPF